MSLSSEASILSKLARTKQALREMILREAATGSYSVQLDYLQCSNEWIDKVVEWLKSEGLNVKKERRMEVPTGFGSCGDEEVEKIYWTIGWV